MLFKQPSLSKPPQATYTAYAAPPPTASLQTLDTFQDQIPQDPIVDTFDDKFEDTFEDTFEDPPLETTTKEESPIIAPTQMEENPEPIRAQVPVQPSPPARAARAPQRVVAAPPRVAAASGWNKIVAKKNANPAVGRIKQTQGVRDRKRDQGSGGRSTRGNGRRRYNKDSNRRR